MFARDMASGAWKFNGETIKFSTDGNLLDGQHRLNAIIQSGCTVKMMVVWGLDESSQDTVDIGAARTVADMLDMEGVERPKSGAAIAKWLLNAEHGNPLNTYIYAPSKPEVEAYFWEHRGEIDLASQHGLEAARRRLPLNNSAFGYAYAMCARVDQEAAEEFLMEGLVRKVMLPPDHIVHALDKRINNSTLRGERGSTVQNMRPEDMVCYTLMAWRIWRKGETREILYAPREKGWINETFPWPDGRKSK